MENVGQKLSFSTIALSTLIAVSHLSSTAAIAQQPPDCTSPPENPVVISLKSNPKSNAEAACLAVTLARVIQSNPYYSQGVTMFPTLDGVALGSHKTVKSPRFKCEVPGPFAGLPPDQTGTISLEDNLNGFLDEGGTMIICPLCWITRYGDTPPDYGELPLGGCVIPEMFGFAEKVIDF